MRCAPHAQVGWHTEHPKRTERFCHAPNHKPQLQNIAEQEQNICKKTGRPVTHTNQHSPHHHVRTSTGSSDAAAAPAAASMPLLRRVCASSLAGGHLGMSVMAWSWVVAAVCTAVGAPQSMEVAGQWVALRNGEGACMDTSCGNPGGVCDRIDLWDCVPDGHDERFRIDPPGSAADCPHGCVRVGPGNVGPNPERVSLAGWCVEALLPSSSSSLLSSGDEADACPNCPSSSQAPCNATSLAQQLTLTGSGTLMSSVKSHDGSQLCVSVLCLMLDTPHACIRELPQVHTIHSVWTS
jgi:hypothetical protein